MAENAILCVDDEKSVLDTLTRQLESHYGEKFVYETAESAEDAWEVIEDLNEEGINMVLVISDWLMPNTKGDEFLVKVHEKFPGTVKILLSGQADQDAVENAKTNGNSTFIAKPWDMQKLCGEIDKIVP